MPDFILHCSGLDLTTIIIAWGKKAVALAVSLSSQVIRPFLTHSLGKKFIFIPFPQEETTSQERVNIAPVSKYNKNLKWQTISAIKPISTVGVIHVQKSNYKDQRPLSLFTLEFVGREVKTHFPFLVTNWKTSTASNMLNQNDKRERLKYYDDTWYIKPGIELPHKYISSNVSKMLPFKITLLF